MMENSTGAVRYECPQCRGETDRITLLGHGALCEACDQSAEIARLREALRASGAAEQQLREENQGHLHSLRELEAENEKLREQVDHQFLERQARDHSLVPVVFELQKQRDDAVAEAQRARRERDRAVAMLRKNEWAGWLDDGKGCYCTECLRYESEGHAPGCELARIIGGGE